MDLDDLMTTYNELCRLHEGRVADRLPTFIGVGAGRCGTSALYMYLLEHPDVFMSPAKEINYFGVRSVATDGEQNGLGIGFYKMFFSGWDQQAQAGEISPVYLTQPGACSEMAATLGRDCRIIVTIRNPVERFISQYWHHSKYLEIEDFSKYVQLAFSQPIETTRFDWYSPGKNLCQSLYAEGIRNYLNQFGKEHVMIIRYESLANGGEVLQRLCSFLNVAFVERPLLFENSSSVRNSIHDSDRELLRRHFERDIDATARLIDMDLSAWVRPYP